MDINYINNLLQQGKTVKEIRSTLGVGEKAFQKEIKKLNYKYNQKTKQYEPLGELSETSLTNISNTTTKSLTEPPTKSTTLSTTESNTLKYLTDNIELIKQLLNYYKNTTSQDKSDIVINLKNDKHLKPKPKTIRINEYVWRDWTEYTKKITLPKGDLVSQALIEFMQNHRLD